MGAYLLSLLLAAPGPIMLLDGRSTPAGVTATGAGTCSTSADNTVLRDNNGTIGCPRTSTTDPDGLMLRPQPCAASDGTCTAANLVLAGGQDTTTIAIDGADPTVTCAGDNDTVTVTVINNAGTSTATVLTEGTDWTAAASVATTCASLATAVDALAGVSASCTSPDVLVTLDATTARVKLEESTAGCTTVATGTQGKILANGDLGVPIYSFGHSTGVGLGTNSSGDPGIYHTGAVRVVFAVGSTNFTDNPITNVGDIDVDSVSADGTTVDYMDVNLFELTEANLTAGACTAFTARIDNNATRELCICNAAGTAYDCWSVTTANGPTD